jgi:hypothetical protein
MQLEPFYLFTGNIYLNIIKSIGKLLTSNSISNLQIETKNSLEKCLEMGESHFLWKRGQKICACTQDEYAVSEHFHRPFFYLR